MACSHPELSGRIEFFIENSSRHGVVVKMSSNGNFENRTPSQSQGLVGVKPTPKEDTLPLRRGGRVGRAGWYASVTADAARLVQQREFAFSRPDLNTQRGQS
jgi:hypothetical protein